MKRTGSDGLKTAVVIPCYRVRDQIMDVLAGIGPEVAQIIVVDDCCPQSSGQLVRTSSRDKRVTVLTHERNRGVGGAMVTGYRCALDSGADVVVKLDGDGQMDPSLLPLFLNPLIEGRADYAKGNRFHDIEFLARMPVLRLLGNSALSLINKAVSGYWDIMDPTNGYTAIHAAALRLIPLEKLDERYFFESDMLFRLGTIRAVVEDVPMRAVYQGEVSSLNIRRVLMEFPGKYFHRFLKRIFYNYFLRDFNAGTMEFVAGLFLAAAGALFGVWKWIEASGRGVPATSGVVMLSAFPILVGAQLLISAVNYDIQSVPRRSLQSRVRAK